MKKIMLSLFSLGLIFFVFSTTPTQAQCSPVDSTVCPIDYQYCCTTDPDGSKNGLYCHFEFYWCFNPSFWNVYDCNCNAAACGYGSSCPAPTPTPPPCVPDGSCSAPPPACEQTTTGTDNCGNPCSLTGPACPTPPPPTPTPILYGTPHFDVVNPRCSGNTPIANLSITSSVSTHALANWEQSQGGFSCTSWPIFLIPLPGSAWDGMQIGGPNNTVMCTEVYACGGGTCDFPLQPDSASGRAWAWATPECRPDLTGSIISGCGQTVTQGSNATFTTLVQNISSNPAGASNTGFNVDSSPSGLSAGVGSYPATQTWVWHTSSLSLGAHTADVWANWEKLAGFPGGIDESNYSNNTGSCSFNVVSGFPTSPPSPPPTSPTPPTATPTPTPTTPPPPTPTPTVPTITCSFTGPTSVVAGSTNTYTDTSTANNTTITAWAWTTTAGSPASGIGSIFNWTAPSSPGTYPVGTISLTVNDGNVAGPESCTNSVPITVSAPTPTPTPSVLSVDLVVDNDPATIGGPSSTKDITNNTPHILTWSSTNTRPVNPCTASSSNSLWTGSKPANDSVGEGTGNLSSPPCSYSYTLTCFDSGGASISDTVNLNIQACGPWLKTTGGDVHTNTNINTPGGP